MTEYNKDRTAFRRYGCWFLVPAGKRRAPWFPKDKYSLYNPSRDDYFDFETLNLLTETDRELLLTSIDEGCFNLVWPKMGKILMYRRENNYELLLKEML